MSAMQVEIGPGDKPLGDGWHHVSALPRHDLPNFHQCWWGLEPLPFADGTVDLFYASHVLEHVPWMQTVDALRELHRCLKPGGVAEIWVPDFAALVDCYRLRICGDNWRHENQHNDPMVWLNGRLFTYGPEPNYHKAAFDWPHLSHCLADAGFSEIEHHIYRDMKPRGHDHGVISLGARAVK